MPADGWLRDGLPQTLEECVQRTACAISRSRWAAGSARTWTGSQAVAATLDRLIAEPYVVSLDGNEQYKALADFAALLEAMARTLGLARFRRSIAFVEQPLDRAVALDPAATEGLAALGRVPIIIDESDGELDSFKRRSSSVTAGCQHQELQGHLQVVPQPLAGRAVERGAAQARRALFMTAEDLTNLPVIPLQQDLATVRALGITHVERNGHHYVKGLAHCSPRERNQATRLHRDIYRGDEQRARGCASRAASCAWARSALPGYGGPFEPDLSSMTPLERWTFDSLESKS